MKLAYRHYFKYVMEIKQREIADGKFSKNSESATQYGEPQPGTSGQNLNMLRNSIRQPVQTTLGNREG